MSTVILASVLAVPRMATAACTDNAPCVDAEPLWLTPAASRFAFISDTARAPFGSVSGAASFGFRWRPTVLTVPAPNKDGRDVNAMSHATDVTVGLRGGIGNGLELTLVVPAGLYQRGAGIKGITHQAAPSIPEQSLHDPRLGFGFAVPTGSRLFGAKLRFELKLPLGNVNALAGEVGPVASPSLALSARRGGLFGGLELGARFRQPAQLFGSRVGSQALVALGAGYALASPRLTFAAEAYALPSLLRAASTRYVPAEWLASLSFTPRAWQALSFGLGGGTGLALSSNGSGGFFGLGVPAFRGLAFVRLSPSEP